MMTAIMVVQDGVTPFAKQVCSQSSHLVAPRASRQERRQALGEFSQKYMIEQFREVELLVNITQHELVPLHVPLSPFEQKALLER